MSPTTNTEEGPRSITNLIARLEDGQLQSDLSVELQDLINTLQSDAKLNRRDASGSLTLKLQVKVDQKGVATVVAASTVNKPTPKRESSTVWVTPGGNLTFDFPRQQGLPGVREVPVNNEQRAPETETSTRAI